MNNEEIAKGIVENIQARMEAKPWGGVPFARIEAEIVVALNTVCAEGEKELKIKEGYWIGECSKLADKCAALDAIVKELRRVLEITKNMDEISYGCVENGHIPNEDACHCGRDIDLIMSDFQEAREIALSIPIPSPSCLDRAIEKAVSERCKPLVDLLIIAEDLIRQKGENKNRLEWNLMRDIQDALAQFSVQGTTKSAEGAK